MRSSEILYSNIEEVKKIFSQYPEVQNPRIFGSIANGTDTEKSDIDILVNVDKTYSLLKLGGLHTKLEDLLKTKVDLVREHNLYNFVRKGIEWDKVKPLF